MSDTTKLEHAAAAISYAISLDPGQPKLALDFINIALLFLMEAKHLAQGQVDAQEAADSLAEAKRPSDLNPTEWAVMQELYKSSDGNGHDFGFTDEVGDACTAAQVPGYITQLSKKGYISPYSDTVNGRKVHQFDLTEKGRDTFGLEHHCDCGCDKCQG